jgi:hypothetical protein
VFAGTVIVPLVRDLISTDHGVGRVFVVRDVRPAAQITLSKAHFRQPGRHQIGMDRRPWCEAQANASCFSDRPAASAAPLSTSGRACIILIALRGRIGAPYCPNLRSSTIVMPDRDMAAMNTLDKRVRE